MQRRNCRKRKCRNRRSRRKNLACFAVDNFPSISPSYPTAPLPQLPCYHSKVPQDTSYLVPVHPQFEGSSCPCPIPRPTGSQKHRRSLLSILQKQHHRCLPLLHLPSAEAYLSHPHNHPLWSNRPSDHLSHSSSPLPDGSIFPPQMQATLHCPALYYRASVLYRKPAHRFASILRGRMFPLLHSRFWPRRLRFPQNLLLVQASQASTQKEMRTHTVPHTVGTVVLGQKQLLSWRSLLSSKIFSEQFVCLPDKGRPRNAAVHPVPASASFRLKNKCHTKNSGLSPSSLLARIGTSSDGG